MLDEAEWAEVFKIRCRTRRGQPISEDGHRLVLAAFNDNRKRYAAMDRAVFEETRPFGLVRDAAKEGPDHE